MFQTRVSGALGFCGSNHAYTLRTARTTLAIIVVGLRYGFRMFRLPLRIPTISTSGTYLQTPYDAFYVRKRPQRHVSHLQAGLVVNVTVSCGHITTITVRAVSLMDVGKIEFVFVK